MRAYPRRKCYTVFVFEEMWTRRAPVENLNCQLLELLCLSVQIPGSTCNGASEGGLREIGLRIGDESSLLHMQLSMIELHHQFESEVAGV